MLIPRFSIRESKETAKLPFDRDLVEVIDRCYWCPRKAAESATKALDNFDEIQGNNGRKVASSHVTMSKPMHHTYYGFVVIWI